MVTYDDHFIGYAAIDDADDIPDRIGDVLLTVVEVEK